MKLFSKYIYLWNAMFLPFFWYRTIVSLWRPDINSVFQDIHIKSGQFLYSIQYAICFYNREYIDKIIGRFDINSFPINQKWQVYLDAGMALFDLGYRDEGIEYLEKAMSIADQYQHPSITPYVNLYQLCCRLNEVKDWDKRLKYALMFDKLFSSNKELGKRLLAKSHIDLRLYDKAENKISELVKLHSYNHIFWADYYYSKGDNKSAAEIFKKYKLDDSQDYWRAQYDYKEAVAYFQTDQLERCHQKAKAIGSRLVWDKYYRLDYLESEGVQRITEIDQVIDASRNQKRWIYPDKLLLILKRLPWVLWKTILIYRYLLLCLLILTLFILMLFLDWLRYLKGKV